MESLRGVTLWLALWHVTRDMERLAQRDISSLGLCLTDFAVLEALLHRGPLRVNVIAEHVMLTSGSMSTAVDRLAGKGLVCRRPSPDDARARLVTLTDEGRALIEPAFATHAEAIDRAFALLDADERQALLRSLLRVRRTARSAEEAT